jgi:nucleoside-diphosphate-sugar epimerase
MKIIVIGGSGHVGTNLVPKLVMAGHKVVNVTRGQRQPYQLNETWKEVNEMIIDRITEEACWYLRTKDTRYERRCGHRYDLFHKGELSTIG